MPRARRKVKAVRGWSVVWRGRLWINDGHALKADAEEEAYRCRMAGDDNARAVRIEIREIPRPRRGR